MKSGNFIYGRNPVVSSLTNNKVHKLYLQRNFSDKKIIFLAKEKNVEIEYIDINKLNELTNSGNHQGVCAIVDSFKYSSLEEIIKLSKGKKQPLILILDEIADPQNLGAIIRTCDAFGVDGIILKSRNQVQINMTVVKVSTGATDFVKIAQVSNLNNTIKELKDNGFWIYASDGSGSQDYHQLKYDRPTALIVGSEGKGISHLVLENSDFIIKIPQTGHVNSLNVSVATGILLANIRR